MWSSRDRGVLITCKTLRSKTATKRLKIMRFPRILRDSHTGRGILKELARTLLVKSTWPLFSLGMTRWSLQQLAMWWQAVLSHYQSRCSSCYCAAVRMTSKKKKLKNQHQQVPNRKWSRRRLIEWLYIHVQPTTFIELLLKIHFKHKLLLFRVNQCLTNYSLQSIIVLSLVKSEFNSVDFSWS